MVYDIAAILPLLTHPLSLAGYAVFAVFGVQRLLIQKGIIPKLSSKDGPAVVLIILKYGFIIGLLLSILGFGLAAYDRWLHSTRKAEANIEISAVDVTYDDYVAVLDIKFRNTGGTVAVVHKILLKAAGIARYTNCNEQWQFSLMNVSAQYDLAIDEEDLKKSVLLEKIVAHEVSPNGSDRIKLRVLSYRPRIMQDKVKAAVELRYNKDNMIATSNEFIFISYGQIKIGGMTNAGPNPTKEEWDNCIEENRRGFCAIGERLYQDDPENVCTRYSTQTITR